ncbi:MAG TPA: hypothetical protein DD827_02140 [Gammaproteobacteria bacterium]|jgi:LmbE family N-acetylglucosaminyl deacetylase|nr:hypothetical protein [Gammaproteobacteria bacterium]
MTDKDHRRWLARFAHWLVLATSKTLSKETLESKPALVFVPHPDDETLGCGGTILIKRERGTAVRVIYMTDGSGASNSSMDLVKIRHTEALEACATLDLEAESVEFMDFSDGHLADFEQQAVPQLIEILKRYPGYELYLPAADDGHPDHEATTRFVAAAAAKTGDWEINEYPVWRWNQYPFVMEKGCGLRCKARQVKSFIRYFLFDSTVKVPVKNQLEQKHSALSKHVSQMTKTYDDENFTLKEIGNGEWLSVLLTDYEVFKRQR